MSSGQQPGPHQPVSTTWTEPPWCGWIETTRDALLILEAARRGLIPRVTRRLVDSERKMITSGSVFVFDEDESGIKRWTDGFFWSPSRILGNFLLYRETDKRGAGHKNIRTDQEVCEEGSSENISLSRPKDAASSSLALDKHRERSLVGSLTNSYKFKSEGLMKKTFSLTIGGVAQHLISYYKIEDVESGRLRSPSSLPELASLDISPEYLDKTHFRNPPKVEIGADGIPRYRGEADDLDISPSPTTLSGLIPASNIPPLLTEGRVTEGSSKRGGKRFDPYAQPSAVKPRPRKNTRASSHDGSNTGGENISSPVASGSSTPTMTAQSPPSAAQPESDVATTVSVPPAAPHPPYGIPACFPGYLPPPGHMYGPAPPPLPQAGVSIAPYPPQAPGSNNGMTSSSSVAATIPSHIFQPGAMPPLHYAPYGYLPTVAHPSNSSTSTNNLVASPTQVRVSDQSQAGLVPITSQQPGPAPVAAAPVPGHPGQVPYNHGPPQYHFSYYPPQFQPHGYAPPPGPVPYPWHYAAYSVPPPPPHPSAGQQQPQAVPVQAGVTSYAPQASQPQQHGSVTGSTQAEEGVAPMEET